MWWVLAGLAGGAVAQDWQPDVRVEITGRTLIVHPELRGEITVVSAQPLDRDGGWAYVQVPLNFTTAASSSITRSCGRAIG